MAGKKKNLKKPNYFIIIPFLLISFLIILNLSDMMKSLAIVGFLLVTLYCKECRQWPELAFEVFSSWNRLWLCVLCGQKKMVVFRKGKGFLFVGHCTAIKCPAYLRCYRAPVKKLISLLHNNNKGSMGKGKFNYGLARNCERMNFTKSEQFVILITCTLKRHDQQ